MACTVYIEETSYLNLGIFVVIVKHKKVHCVKPLNLLMTYFHEFQNYGPTKKKLLKKFRGLVGSEFVKTCHEHVIHIKCEISN